MAEAHTIRTPDAAKTWIGSAISELVISPMLGESVALTVADVDHADKAATDYRIPVVSKDPVAAWVEEGAEIAATDTKFDEATDVFHKLAGLVVVSREMAEDSTTSAATHIGLGLARDLSRKIDAAFFGSRGADNTTPPKGLEDLTGVTAVDVQGTAFTDLDPFITGQYLIEARGASVKAYVANPSDAIELASIKDEDGSRRPLLGGDATRGAVRTIGGVPLLTSSAVKAGTVWGIPDGRVVAAIREDATITRDESVYFTSDRIAIRATLRMTFIYPDPGSILKITHAS